jgi:hypothetical protein
MPATGVSATYPLGTRTLRDGETALVQLQGGASAYHTFVVPENQEALIQIGGAAGALLANGIRLSLVRIK